MEFINLLILIIVKIISIMLKKIDFHFIKFFYIL
jgi:hypothetical protein